MQICTDETHTKLVSHVGASASPKAGIGYQAVWSRHVRLDKVFDDVTSAVAPILIVAVISPVGVRTDR
ncbi:hypothetical protein [Vibrio penaeicida]|uniref:hypothetical protein n=1 Tax=Vibrio penaeicida TaxID=104609 RepID=UPI001CC3A377|nr:hypothetical protein [Vibrio penaeicida]